MPSLEQTYHVTQSRRCPRQFYFTFVVYWSWEQLVMSDAFASDIKDRKRLSPVNRGYDLILTTTLKLFSIWFQTISPVSYYPVMSPCGKKLESNCLWLWISSENVVSFFGKRTSNDSSLYYLTVSLTGVNAQWLFLNIMAWHVCGDMCTFLMSRIVRLNGSRLDDLGGGCNLRWPRWLLIVVSNIWVVCD